MLNKEFIIGGISGKELLVLTKELHASTRAGFSIVDGLKLGLMQARGRMKQVLGNMIKMVESGAYLYEALEKFSRYFPPLFLNLVKTGEISGSLEGNLKRLTKVLSKEIEFGQKIRAAMIYPIFVLIAISGLGLSVSFFVLPNLLPLFQSLHTALPTSTKILLWLAEGFKNHGLAIALGILAVIVLLTAAFRQKSLKPATHWLVLRLPVVGTLVKKLALTRLSQTMQSLLESGVPIDRGIEICVGILNNQRYKAILTRTMPLISKGEPLSESLKKYPDYFEPLFIQLLSLGEKTGSLEETFGFLSEYYETDVDERMKNLAVSLEPILLIVVGCMVGFVAQAIIGPIYSLTGSVR